MPAYDALGKLRGEPVYMLLGGKTKARLPVYATSTRPNHTMRYVYMCIYVYTISYHQPHLAGGERILLKVESNPLWGLASNVVWP